MSSAIATVTFTKPDGSTLAFVPPRLLERRGGEGRFVVVRTLEGSQEYRRRAILDEAERRGYLAGMTELDSGTIIRGTYTPPKGAAGKRIPVLARRDGDAFEVKLEHVTGAEWRRSSLLTTAIIAAVEPALEAMADLEAIDALAGRLLERLEA